MSRARLEASADAELQTIELSHEAMAHLAAMAPDSDKPSSDMETVLFPNVPPSQRSTVISPASFEGYLPRRQVSRLAQSSTAGGPGVGDPDYRIVGRLGAGGTAIVFQAHQRAVDREVALKYLRADLPDLGRARQRFLDEARVIGSLDHPNVIAIHEVCLDQNDEVFYAMKRVDGTTWDQRLDDLTVEKNISILMGVADAIRYAHSRGLVHRDIKPANVMLGQFGEVLLADWGLAFFPRETKPATSVAESIGGTPAYMAPELALGLWSQISHRTDIYLLGGLLYRIVTGVMPHHGDTLVDCIRAAADNLIQPTSVEGELVDIARRAMNTRPADRFGSVDEFMDAVRAQQQHAQSIRLVRRAEERLAEIDDDAKPDAFSLIDNLLVDAVELWQENPRASEVRRRSQIRHAEILVARDDLETALTLYEAAGMGDSDVVHQIRQRRQEEQHTQRRVSRYSTLFFNSPDAGLLVKVPEGVIVEINEAFGTMFGHSVADLVGKRIPDLNLWVCPERQAEMLAQIADTGRIDDFETQLYRSDGGILDVVIAGRSIKLESQPMMVSTIRDVSRRKAAERNLEQSRTRLRDLQRLAGLATWSYNVSDDSVTWSEELFRLTGRPMSEGTPTRQEFYEMVHPTDRERMRSVVSDAVKQGLNYEITIRQAGPGGEYQRVLVRGEPVRDEAGEITEVFGVSMRQT